MTEISPFLIERYKQERKEEVKPATVNRELALLRHMFTMAVKWGKATKNPVSEVKFFKEPKGSERILSWEEEDRLLQAVGSTTKSKHIEPIVITALNTGMRKGEILNLQWPQVDFRSGVITVVGGVEGTKNGEFRKIPMNKKLTETLERVKKESSSEYVFSENGKPYSDIKTGWWSALEKAKIEGLRFHDLRHTFGTRLGMKGYDIKTIAELMGHKDLKMTMRYSHPTPEHKKMAVESLDRVTTFFTTGGGEAQDRKVVNIGNH